MNESRSFRDEFPKSLGRIARPNEALSLAHRPDFGLGQATIRPSLLIVEGPAGRAVAEPRVMRVLLALVDAEGAVLTRDDFIRICWDDRIVGDDSINRAIAEVRRLVRATAAGFEIETIPRVGYRLSLPESEEAAAAKSDGAAELAPQPIGMTRRALVAAGVAAAAGCGFWYWRNTRPDTRVAGLVEQGRRSLRDALPDGKAQGVTYLREAVAIDPDNAEAWGLLALAHRNRAENAGPREMSAAVQEAESAARRALQINRNEGHALTALATLRPEFGDWLAAEDRLRAVLAVAPDNLWATNALVSLLQSVGRLRESWNFNERAIAIDPLAPIALYRRAIKYWTFGRVAQSDLAIEQALRVWPRHPGVWNQRLVLFAFTGRPTAALAMLDDVEARPPTLSQPTIRVWRDSLAALQSRSPADIRVAREANFAASARSPGFAVNAIMTLSSLGDIDAAFTVAEGYLLRRGPLVGPLWNRGGQMPVNDQRWRKAMMLFTPAVLPLFDDPRFAALCEGIGLTDYWRRRGVTPERPVAAAILGNSS